LKKIVPTVSVPASDNSCTVRSVTDSNLLKYKSENYPYFYGREFVKVIRIKGKRTLKFWVKS
jgi:hypothetical protein